MNREKKLESILVIVLGLLVLYLVFKTPVLLLFSLGIGVLSLASEYMLTKITWAWFKLAAFLGYINGTILLSLVYFFILCPIAFLYRITHNDPLQLKRKPEGSYFKTRNHTFTPKDLENMW